jgi:hypothetical protein
LKQAEVLGFDPDINGEPGMYLQFVEGCGYDVYELTPDEARELAGELAAEADRQSNQPSLRERISAMRDESDRNRLADWPDTDRARLYGRVQALSQVLAMME